MIFMLNDYNHLAESYKETDAKPDKRFSILPTVLRALGDLAGKTVVDLGCGSGFFSLAFARHGAKKVYGFDDSAIQITEAKATSRPNLEYAIKDVVNEPLSSTDIACVPFLINYFRSADK